jgi:hypothetical protein
MAIGMYTAYVETPQTTHKKSSMRRTVVLSGLMAAAMCAAVMYAATPHDEEDAKLLSKVQKMSIVKNLKDELKAAETNKPTDQQLALKLIKHAQTMSVKGLEGIITTWKNAQISDLDVSKGNKGQMLAFSPAITSSLQEESQLCAKKEIIFEKFNELLKKLGHENVERNASDQAAYEAKEAALEAWLDGESAYRLEVEKAKEAKEGATFARAQYEKWKATTLDTQDRLDKMNEKYPKEKANIEAERELIKTIMRYLGILDDQPVDEASAKAGGYMNPDIDHPNAPAAAKAPLPPAKLAQIKAEIKKLKEKAMMGDGVKLALVNKLESKLASFAETDFVKNLLEQMLKDLELREEVLTKALEETKTELEEHKGKLQKYELEVVNLSNAEDKASERAAERNLERQKLDGNKINSAENYQNEYSEFAIVAPPADKAIFILRMIMKKITDYCAGNAAAMQ